MSGTKDCRVDVGRLYARVDLTLGAYGDFPNLDLSTRRATSFHAVILRHFQVVI